MHTKDALKPKFNYPTAISQSRKFPPVSSPLFFGAALRDVICTAPLGKAAMANKGLRNHSITVKEFDGDHWVLQNPDTAAAISHELDAWIQTVVAPDIKLKARV